MSLSCLNKILFNLCKKVVSINYNICIELVRTYRINFVNIQVLILTFFFCYNCSIFSLIWTFYSGTQLLVPILYHILPIFLHNQLRTQSVY